LWLKQVARSCKKVVAQFAGRLRIDMKAAHGYKLLRGPLGDFGADIL
jgi:hypothetical protein